MRTRLTSRLSLLFMAFALVLALPAMAFADTLQVNNTLVVGSNVSKDPGQSGTGKVWLETTDPSDPVNGCDATGSNPATVTFTSSDTSKIANPDSVTLTGCGTSAAKDFSYNVASTATAGTVQISGAVSGGKAGSTYNTSDSLTVTINAPAKADTSISNVSGSGTYGGNATLTAKLSSSANNLSGKNVAFELNGQSVGTDATDANGVAELSGVSLSGIDAGTYNNAVSANFTGDSGYNGSSGAGNLAVGKASSTTTVSCGAGPFTYTGLEQTPCTVSVTGAGGLNLSPDADYSNNTNAGQATASYTFTGDANHTGSSDSKNFTIGKANATIDVQGYTGNYDGDAHSATGTAKGVQNEDLSSLLDLGASFTNVPGGTANWSFAGNGNYNADSGSVAIDISKADATIDVQGYTGVYDGNAHGASGSATGVKDEDLSNLLDLGASFTNVPGGTANWSFAGNGNYNADNGSVPIDISKATPSINITWSNSTYNGNANAASASVSGVGNPAENLGTADSLVYYAGNAATGTPLAGAPTNAGTYTVKAIFNGAANYNATSATKTITIAKANPQITWSTPAAIDYGTALSSTQLNASADVAGSFSYTPPAGTVLKAGTKTLQADFTPADSANYNNASAQVQIVVNPYSFTGFFQPIDMGIYNSAKAGSTIPVKFSLGGDKGMTILAASSPSATKVSCDPSVSIDAVEETTTATSGLKYDPVANQYIYNWKTASSYAGTCQRLTVSLADGTTVKSALFKFTK